MCRLVYRRIGRHSSFFCRNRLRALLLAELPSVRRTVLSRVSILVEPAGVRLSGRERGRGRASFVGVDRRPSPARCGSRREGRKVIRSILLTFEGKRWNAI